MVRFSQNFLKHLAALSLSLTTEAAFASTSLAEIPTEVLAEVIDEVETECWRPEDRARVVRLLAADARAETRVMVAAAAGSLFPGAAGSALELLERLAMDEAPEVRAASASALSEALARATLAERVEIICQWTLSEERHVRAAAARALAQPLALFVTDLAIEQLAEDDDAEIRLLALTAADRHFQENPSGYRALAERLVGDADRSVRRAARRLLETGA